eukprot:CAMPEP_0171809080 /NCGR_PEP_ID=MMETSP0991-20121206/76744_1 /TAXON_ID=483369 /ORGANISM="non described non described, Strain CCMP2098" /LENGTH=102 /DNA_ID=CAMNT_0012422077 /DNA_START=742 /DNA_END=1048 /DNA_ORIENTATION=+
MSRGQVLSSEFGEEQLYSGSRHQWEKSAAAEDPAKVEVAFKLALKCIPAFSAQSWNLLEAASEGPEKLPWTPFALHRLRPSVSFAAAFAPALVLTAAGHAAG